MIVKKLINRICHPLKTYKNIKRFFLFKNAEKYDDLTYIKKQFKLEKGYKLNIDKPVTFNEKLQWLKLYYHNPICTTCSDKLLSKDYIKEILGKDNCPKTLGYWACFDDIDFTTLPDKFMLKTNNGSGGNVVCLDKKTFDKTKAREKINKSLNDKYFYSCREWPYKDIKPFVLAEEYLACKDGSDLVDYKFYCFNGKMEYFLVSIGEYSHKVKNHKFNRELQSVDYLFKKKPSLDEKDTIIPGNIKEMIDIADKLSKPFPHVRIDMFNIDGTIYIGEMTFYSNGGYINILNKEYDKYLGSLIPLVKYE